MVPPSCPSSCIKHYSFSYTVTSPVLQHATRIQDISMAPLVSSVLSDSICVWTSYRLRTQVKPNQPSKGGGMYARSYYTKAGLGDAVLVYEQSNGTIGCLTPNPPNETSSVWAPKTQTRLICSSRLVVLRSSHDLYPRMFFVRP